MLGGSNNLRVDLVLNFVQCSYCFCLHAQHTTPDAVLIFAFLVHFSFAQQLSYWLSASMLRCPNPQDLVAQKPFGL